MMLVLRWILSVFCPVASCPDGGCLGVRCHITCPVVEAVFLPPPSPRCPALPSIFFTRTKHLKCFTLTELVCCSCSEICSETFAASYRFLWYRGILRKWGVKVMKKLKMISDQKPGLLQGAVTLHWLGGGGGGGGPSFFFWFLLLHFSWGSLLCFCLTILVVIIAFISVTSCLLEQLTSYC